MQSPIDLYWYDGGMKPSEPGELAEDNRQLGITGLMFVGDKGKILDNRIIPESRGKAYLGAAYVEPGAGRGGRSRSSAAPPPPRPGPTAPPVPRCAAPASR